MPYPILSVPTAPWVSPEPLRWSLARPNTDFRTADVRMTEAGKPIPLNIVYRNGPTDRMAGDPVIVWQPQISPEFGIGMADRRFDVTVSGALASAEPQSYHYQVTVFDPSIVTP